MFDLRRFARLAAAEWIENRRAWAWFLAIGIIVHFVLVLVLLSDRSAKWMFRVESQQAVFFAGLFLTAPIFAGRYFQAMARPGAALLALMRPASTFEKWLLAAIVVGVAYPVAYHLAFLVCNVPATWIARTQADPFGAAVALPTAADMRLFHAFGDYVPARAWIGIGLGLAALQGFAVTGCLVFRRWPFVKTVVAGFLVLLASMLLATALRADTGVFLSYWDERGVYAPWLVPVAWFAVPALLWLAAALALREREVAA